jgi:hypothetical protein
MTRKEITSALKAAGVRYGLADYDWFAGRLHVSFQDLDDGNEDQVTRVIRNAAAEMTDKGFSFVATDDPFPAHKGNPVWLD